MFWALPNEHHLRWAQRDLIGLGRFRFCGHNPTGTPNQTSRSFRQCPQLLLHSHTNCTQPWAPQEIGGKKHQPARCVTSGRKGCSHLRHSPSFFNMTRFLKISPFNPLPLNIICTAHTWDPTHTPILSHWLLWFPAIRTNLKILTTMRSIQFPSPFLSQQILSFLSSLCPLKSLLHLDSSENILSHFSFAISWLPFSSLLLSGVTLLSNPHKAVSCARRGRCFCPYPLDFTKLPF